MSAEEPTSGSSEQSSQSRREELSPEMSFEDNEDPGGEFAEADPDVTLDVPEVKVEELNLEVEQLKARVALRTRLAELLDINVGVDIDLEGVKLEAKGVEAVAQLKARLENVQAIIARTLASVDENPQILDSLTQMSKTAARSREGGPERALGSSGDSVVAGEQPKEQEPAEERPQTGVKLTDAARRRAEELGVDPSKVQGMGARGRVLVSDVERAASGESAMDEG